MKKSETKDKFTIIANAVLDAVIMIDEDGIVTFWNPAAELMFGHSSDDIIGKAASEVLCPPMFHVIVIEGARKSKNMDNGHAVGRICEIECIRMDGEKFPVEAALSEINIDGQWLSIAMIRDITKRKKVEEELNKYRNQLEDLVEKRKAALDCSIEKLLNEGNKRKKIEEALRKSEEKYRNLVESANDGIAIVENTQIKYANSRLAEITGYTVEEAIGKSFVDLIRPADRDRFIESNRKSENNRDTLHVYETVMIHKDGSSVYVEINTGIIPFQGNSAQLVCIRDITERKMLRTQLSQSQKLEAIGTLAAGIAHEINTPTQYVGDNVRFIQDTFNDLSHVIKKYSDLLEACETGSDTNALVEEIKSLTGEVDLEFANEEVPKAIAQSLEGIERVKKIVRAMRDFAHPGPQEKTPMDINKAIESTITVARNEWKYVADMVTDFDPELPTVPCIPDDFKQVILNLIVNAAHAIESLVGDGAAGKGTITVTTHNKSEWVEIRIRDTGTGIPEKARPRVFDPFFTTKEVGKGTGQGLAIAHRIIVDKHRGEITFETKEGEGTTFIIHLPASLQSNGGEDAFEESGSQFNNNQDTTEQAGVGVFKEG